jgi:hypothetical protein
MRNCGVVPRNPTDLGRVGIVSQKVCTLGLTQADNLIECEAERVCYGFDEVVDWYKLYYMFRIFLRLYN